jgi:hypothetical protein
VKPPYQERGNSSGVSGVTDEVTEACSGVTDEVTQVCSGVTGEVTQVCSGVTPVAAPESLNCSNYNYASHNTPGQQSSGKNSMLFEPCTPL